MTETEELAKRFPARPEIGGERRVGAELAFVYPNDEAPPQSGEIVDCQEPRLFAFTWRASGEEAQLVRSERRASNTGR
jgi:hypothetical protein